MDEKFVVYIAAPFHGCGHPYVFIALGSMSEDESIIERFVLLPDSEDKNAKISLGGLLSTVPTRLGRLTNSISADVLYEEEKKFIEPQIRALLRNYIGIKAFDHNYKANLRSISASSLASACKFNPEFLKALNEIQKFTKCKKLNQFIEEAKSFCSETKATI